MTASTLGMTDGCGNQLSMMTFGGMSEYCSFVVADIDECAHRHLADGGDQALEEFGVAEPREPKLT